ncbi:hypothetical protein REPUB_Repub06bG0104500 [Reevesia pubescens]
MERPMPSPVLLKLIRKGDIVGAKRLDSDSRDASSYPENSEGSQELGSIVHDSEAVNLKEWTSLQLTEAMLVVNNRLKLKYKECKNCDAKNPAITKPTFGWFHTERNEMEGRKPSTDLRSEGMSVHH